MQLVDVGLADGLGRLERPTPVEDREPRKQALLVGIEQVERPFDRRTERLLPDLGITAPLEQVESCPEPVQELFCRENRRPRRGELERQRQIVEAGAELIERAVGREVRPHRLGARSKERTRFRAIEDRDGIHVLTVQLEPLAARHRHVEVRACRQ